MTGLCRGPWGRAIDLLLLGSGGKSSAVSCRRVAELLDRWCTKWLSNLATLPSSQSACCAGDSRCVLSKRGQARALTLDHKPILFEEAKRIIKVRCGLAVQLYAVVLAVML